MSLSMQAGSKLILCGATLYGILALGSVMWLSPRDPRLRMLWKLARKKAQLPRACLVPRKTSGGGQNVY